jgi:hypothetical protein
MSNISNIDGVYDKNDCGVICPLLFGVFIGIILLYALIWGQELCNYFNAQHISETDLAEDLLETGSNDCEA